MPNTRPRVALLVAGEKGANFVDDLGHEACAVVQIVSYEQSNDDAALSRIRESAARRGAPLVETRRPAPEILGDADLIFVVGWQFLLDLDTSRAVIFHDSLLPKYRGFGPTVTALIAGDTVIGVSAIMAAADADAGDVFASASVDIAYPMRIADAFEALRHAYLDAATQVLRAWRAGSLRARPQDDQLATYSIWRDDSDYEIDWSWPADRIVRFIHAVGPPYQGARTLLSGETLVVRDAVELSDLHFVDRQPGKLWRLSAAGPEVVCGRGIVRLSAVERASGDPYVFSKLRSRLGRR